METNVNEAGKPLFSCDELRRSVMTARQIIDSTLCLDFTYIREHAIIEKHPYATHGIVKTLEGYLISFQSNYGNEEHYSLEITYFLSPIESYNLKVTLIEVPSNLGKGSLLYFICPQTGRKCRKLYKLPFSNHWASRGSYKGQLYYITQICSRLQLLSHNFQKLEDWINKSECKTKYKFYQGKKTKRFVKEEMLMAKLKMILSDQDIKVVDQEKTIKAGSLSHPGKSKKSLRDNFLRDCETVSFKNLKWDCDFNESETTTHS